MNFKNLPTQVSFYCYFLQGKIQQGRYLSISLTEGCLAWRISAKNIFWFPTLHFWKVETHKTAQTDISNQPQIFLQMR